MHRHGFVLLAYPGIKQLTTYVYYYDKNQDGLTPLHCAARSGHEGVVDLLLDKGAPISAKTKNGLAALHMSSQGDHVESARTLIHHKAPVDDVTVVSIHSYMIYVFM